MDRDRRFCEDPRHGKRAVRIELNGKVEEVDDGTTVAALIETLGLRPDVVAVEVNQDLVRKDRRASVRLAAGDRVEVVTLVGGG